MAGRRSDTRHESPQRYEAPAKPDATETRRAIAAAALAEALEHLTVPEGSMLKPNAVVALDGGEQFPIKWVEIEGDRVRLLAATKDGHFDAVTTTLDRIAYVRLVGDSRRRHVEPYLRAEATAKMVVELVASRRCPQPEDSLDLRALTRTEKGMAAVEAAITGSDENLINAITDAIQSGRGTLGDLGAEHREALRRTVAMDSARELLDRSWRPYVREDEWLDEAAALCAKD